MIRQAEYRVEITNRSGSSIITDPVGVGNPVTGEPGWAEIKLSPRYKQAGSGTVSCRALPDLLAAVKTANARVVVRRTNPFGDETVEMSGPIEDPEDGYTAEEDGVDGHGKLTIQFADDLKKPANRLVFPDPQHDLAGQTVLRYTVPAGNAEQAIRTLFNLQCGPGAPIPVRRLPGVVMGAAQSDTLTQPGTSFTKDKFVNDALRELSVATLTGGIGVGFRMRQVGGTIEFQTFTPQDRASSVIFSRELGNLVSLVDRRIAPTCTVAYVGDATAGVNRLIRKKSNQAALNAGWDLMEVFVDGRSAANVAELDQLADKALADGAPKRQLVAVVRETPQIRWRYDIDLGDMATVIDSQGLPVTRQVIGADYTITPAREQILPILGEDGDLLVDAAQQAQILLEKRVASLEGSL